METRPAHGNVNVLLGANYAEFGGVRHHLQGIAKHSKLNVEMAPPQSLMDRIGLHECAKRMESQLKDFDASKLTAVHSHVYPGFIEWCRYQQQVFGAYWVHTYHLNYYPEHSRHELESWQRDVNRALLETARYADVCLSVSRWQCDELRALHGIECRYIPNGVDVSKCDQASPDRFRCQHHLNRFILYVGRNDPVKNPEQFVELARQLPDITCVMIGGGLDANWLEQHFAEPPANLLMLGGQSAAVVQDAISAASVLVVTSKREGLPTLVLEALVHETPIVIPDEVGCMEAAAQGRFAEVYAKESIEDLRRATLHVLESSRPSRSSRQWIEQNFDWKVVGSQLDEVFLNPHSLASRQGH